jgi:hypothetical protein
VQERSTNGQLGTVEKADVLLDFPRHRIDAIAAEEPNVARSRIPQLGPRTFIRTDNELVTYTPNQRSVGVTKLPPGGAVHPDILNPMRVPFLFTTTLFGMDLGSEPLRAIRARSASSGRTMVAIKATDPNTGRTLFRIATALNGELLPVGIVLDPHRDYLVTAVECPQKLYGGVSIAMRFTTVGGLHIPVEIEQIKWGRDGRFNTCKQTLTNVRAGERVAESEFQVESLGLPNGTGRSVTSIDGVTEMYTHRYLNGKWVTFDEYRRLNPRPATTQSK